MFKLSHSIATGAYVAPECTTLTVCGNKVLASSTGTTINSWTEDSDGLEC